ncbi:MAG: Cyclic di-GMP phosphodiesterase response regulator RpfG [Anaerolineales bacterium]|nr:Cyclic di-GMP phosphodiesterase response regulator RpfG [Anaerolineales bacterium]
MEDTPRILIVDDDESSCRSLTRIFDKTGYETETAGTGREATEKAQARFFNLALLDIRLPDMEGVELIAPLQELHPDMVVIMVTAYASAETAVQALNEGASAYVTKPLNMDAVLATIREALEKQRAEDALRKSEAILNETQKLAKVGGWELDLETRERTWTEEVSRICEVAPDYNPTFETGFSFYTPEHRPIIEQAVQGAIETGEPWDLELQIITAKGNRRWVRTRGRAHREDGRAVRLSGTFQDITERKQAEESLHQHAAQLEALREVELGLAAELDLDDLLRSIVSRAVELLGGYLGAIDLYRPDLDMLEWIVSVGLDQPPPASFLHRGEGLCGKVWESGEPLIVNDYHQWEGRAAGWESYPFQAVMGVPVRWGEEFLGVLEVSVASPRTFSPADAELLSLFANQAAIAIRNARLYDDARSRAERLAVVNRIASAVGAILELDDLMETVYQEIDSIFHADAFFIALYDEEANELDFRIQVDEGVREPAGRQPLEAGLTSLVVAEKKSLLIRDMEQERDRLPSPEVWGTMKLPASWLGAPMLIGQRLMGVICVQDYRPYAYGEDEELLLSTIADQVAVAVEQARLYEAEREQRRRAQSLEKAAAALTATLDPDRVLDRILDEVSYVVPNDAANIMLIEGDQVRAVRWRGYERFDADDLFSTLELDFSELVGLRQMAESREPLAIPDVTTYPGWVQVHEWLRSYAAAPIIVHDEVIGFLSVDSVTPGFFSQAHAEALRAFANHAAAALENARLYEAVQQELTERKRAEEALRQRHRQLSVLNRMGRALAGTLELARIYRIAYEHVAQLVDSPNFGISLYDPTTRTLQAEFMLDEGELIDAARFPPLDVDMEPTQGRVRAIATRQPEIITDYPSVLEKARDGGGVRVGVSKDEHVTGAAMYVPMVAQDQVIGLLEVQSYQLDAYGVEHAALLGPVANQIGLSIQNARLFDEIRRRADETAALLATAHAISSLEREAVLETIASQAKALFKADGSRIHLIEPDGETLRCVVALHERAEAALATRLKLGQGLTGHVALNGEPEIINAALGDPRAMQMPGTPVEQETLALAPLKVHERVVGVMTVTRLGEERPFTPSDLALLTAFADQAAIALENARLFAQTQRRLEYLRALHEVDAAITASLDLGVTLDILLNQVTTQLHVDAADVLLFTPHTQRLEYAAGRGFRTAALRHTHLRLGEGLASRAALEQQIINIADLRQDKDAFERAPLLDGEGFISYFGVPLIAKGKIKGVLEVFHRAPLHPSEEWVDFLETLSTQAAIAIDNAELFEDLQHSNVELTQAYDTTLEGWAHALELRDHETEGHSRRVTEMTVRLGRAMGVSQEELVHVRRGALLHDIGKMGVPDSILLKPGSPTDDEWDIIRQHPVHAYEMLRPIPYLRPALDIPYYHHERWDGAGYPQGLKGEAIPLPARIFAVVDVYDALTSDRPYRDAWSEEDAVEHIHEEAGQHFDPEVVGEFLEIINPSASEHC